MIACDDRFWRLRFAGTGPLATWLERHGEVLIATYNGRLPGRVVQLTLSGDLRTLVDFTVLETITGPGEPSLGEVIGDAFYFISNSPWSAFDDAGARKPGSVMAPPEIRRQPLTPAAARAAPPAAPSGSPR